MTIRRFRKLSKDSPVTHRLWGKGLVCAWSTDSYGELTEVGCYFSHPDVREQLIFCSLDDLL